MDADPGQQDIPHQQELVSAQQLEKTESALRSLDYGDSHRTVRTCPGPMLIVQYAYCLCRHEFPAAAQRPREAASTTERARRRARL